MLDRTAIDETIQAEMEQLRRQREAAFAAASRHTRRVRFLRRAIPTGCVVGVAGFLGWTFLDPLRALPVGVEVGKISISGTKITMEAPRLTGFKRDNRSYVVSAASATQDPRKPNVIEMKTLTADIELTGGGKARLQAASGVYDSGADHLELWDAVHVTSESGYDVRTTKASVDMKAGHVQANEPVKVVFSGGTVDADTMEIVESGKVITFIGHVDSLLVPKDEGGRPQDAKADAKTVEGKAVEGKAVEGKAVEVRAVELKADAGKAAGADAPEARPEAAWSDLAGPMVRTAPATNASRAAASVASASKERAGKPGPGRKDGGGQGGARLASTP